MADEKAKIVTDATGPSSGPAPAQPEVDAQVSKQEQSAPEAPTPDKAEAPAQKEAPSKKDKAVQKSAQPGKTEKAAPSEKTEKAPKAPSPAKGAPEVKAPVQAETPAAPAEAPRPGKEEQIVYIKLSELHAFKNHPFQVRNDEEMKAMVSSVRDKGVTQPAIVRPREDGGYEIVSGHRRQKASELGRSRACTAATCHRSPRVYRAGGQSAARGSSGRRSAAPESSGCISGGSNPNR